MNNGCRPQPTSPVEVDLTTDLASTVATKGLTGLNLGYTADEERVRHGHGCHRRHLARPDLDGSCHACGERLHHADVLGWFRLRRHLDHGVLQRPLLHPGHDLHAAGADRHQSEQRHGPGAALRRRLRRPAREGDRCHQLPGPGHRDPGRVTRLRPRRHRRPAGGLRRGGGFLRATRWTGRAATSDGKLGLQVRAYIKDAGSLGPAAGGREIDRPELGHAAAELQSSGSSSSGTSVSCSRTSASFASRSPAGASGRSGRPRRRDELLVEGVGLGDVGAWDGGVPGEATPGQIEGRLLVGAVGIGRGTRARSRAPPRSCGRCRCPSCPAPRDRRSGPIVAQATDG